MENHKRHHSKEFKQTLIDLCLVTKQSCADLAREYDLESDLIRRWEREYLKFGKQQLSNVA